jgi:undecaprenyl-diphosphatase
MIEFLSSIDTSIFLFCNGTHTLFWDHFMMLCTDRFIWVPLYVVLFAAIFGVYGVKRMWIYVAAIALAIFLTDQICATIIRPMVERMRPSNLANPLSALTIVVDDYRGGAYGFPSCHAANSFALAAFVALIFRKRSVVWFIVGWAILNSFTRLYLGVHYPSDLFVGALIGSTIGLICYFIAKIIDRQYDNTHLLHRLSAPLFHLHVGTTDLSINISGCLIATGVLTCLISALLAL